jgi:glutamate--cysteine ligase
MIRTDGEDWSVPARFSFGDWLQQPDCGPCPASLDDLEYHLSTLFPVVRPRGAVEVRYLDAQRGDGWVLPLALMHALLEDTEAAAAATEATALTAGEWTNAARRGVRDRQMQQAATTLCTAAGAALERLDAPRWLVSRLAEFAECYPARGRSPADDLRDAGPGAEPRFVPCLDEKVPMPVGATP